MLDVRRERMLGPDGARGAGLEIGALHAPVLSKAEHDVLYVDYAATEVLRANQFDPAVPLDDIVEVDVVWGETPLVEAVGRQVDYIVASHVIEHVPDLIGWLAELHQVLREGGLLGLAVPDKRFTFDALRKDSVLAEAVEANLLGYRRPSLRQVFDVASQGIAIDPALAWAGRPQPGARAAVLERLEGAWRLAESLAAKPRYNDAHCWVFTPASFLALIEEFAVLGRFAFAVEAFHPTERGGHEFHLRLRAIAPDQREAALASIRAAQAGLAEPPPEPARAEAGEVEALRAALEGMRRSTSWRLTAPLRALGALLKR